MVRLRVQMAGIRGAESESARKNGCKNQQVNNIRTGYLSMQCVIAMT